MEYVLLVASNFLPRPHHELDEQVEAESRRNTEDGGNPAYGREEVHPDDDREHRKCKANHQNRHPEHRDEWNG